MMMRSDDTYTPTEGCSAEELLKCLTADDYDACVAACSNEAEEEQDPEEVKAGTLNVTMKSEEGGDVPYGISALPVVTYTLKAADEDINISSLVLSQAGYWKNATITNAALFIDGQRVSKAKDIDLNKNATINLTNAYTLKAGKSVNIEVRVTLWWAGAAGDQFALKIEWVESSAEKTNLPSNVTSNTFKVVNTSASTSNVINLAAVDAPKAWTDNAEIFEFSIWGNATQDVTVKNITFMWLGSATTNAKDYKDFLKNVKLLLDDKVVATAEMNGKYLTFNLKDDVVVEKGKTEIFTVKADVIGWAGEDLDFTIENAMDVVINGNTYNAPVTVAWAMIGATAPVAKVTILAWKVTIERTNPNETTFVRNTKNVYLWSFTINNNGDNALTMEKMWLKVTSTATAWGLGSEEYIEAIKVRYGSTSAGLTELTDVAGLWIANNAVLTDDTEIAIKGKTTVYVYADIAAKQLKTSTTTDVAFNKDEAFSISLDKASFKFVEDENDTTVTEVSYPAAFTTMESANSTLTVTQVTLGNKSFSKWTADIDAVSFKVKTSSTAGVKIKNLVFDATSLARARATVALDAAGDGADTAKAAWAVAIAWWTYEKAVAVWDKVAYLIEDLTAGKATDRSTLAVNALDGVADADANSSVLVDEWVATIDSNTIRNAKLIVNDKDEYDLTIGSNTLTLKTPVTLDANTTNTFVVKVSLESEPKAYSFKYDFDWTNTTKFIAEDTTSDRNTINAMWAAAVNGRTISVLSAWTVTLSYEANAANNKSEKTILAGDSAVVAEYNLYATHELAKAKGIELTFSSALLKDSIDDVEVYYWEELVASNPTWTAWTAKFTDVNMTISENETPLTIKVISSKVNADGWKTIINVKLNTVTLKSVSGKTSWISLWDIAETPAWTSVKAFAIVPVTLLATVDNVSNSNTNTLNITANRGENTDANSVAAKATVQSITFTVNSNNALTKIFVKDSEWNEVCKNTTVNKADGDFVCTPTTPYLLSNWTESFTVQWTVDWSINTVSYTMSVKSIAYTTNVDATALTYTTSPLLNVISR